MAAALAGALAAVEARRDVLGRELDAGAAAGEETAAALRACAHEESELQARLKQASDAVTATEVGAQQARDSATEVQRELGELAGRLGLEAEPATEALPDEERAALAARVERLRMRREQLGPVNPLAGREYEEAVAHVEELEAQRRDLEGALAELEGLIKETDRRIKESFEQTFAAAARNFEEVVEHLFPGGRGRLRLVRADQAPRAVVGGEDARGRGRAAEEPTRRTRQPESWASRSRSRRRASRRSACRCSRAARSRSWRSPSCSPSSSPGLARSTSSTRWRRRSTTSTSTASSSSCGATPTARSSSSSRTRSARWTRPTRSTG